MFDISDIEIKKVIDGYFTSEKPLILRKFPTRQKRKYIALKIIIKLFKKDIIYTEKEVNEILKPIYFDYVGIRRALIDFKLMCRTKDCLQYWVES